MSYSAVVLIKLLHFANSTFAFQKQYIIDPTRRTEEKSQDQVEEGSQKTRDDT